MGGEMNAFAKVSTRLQDSYRSRLLRISTQKQILFEVKFPEGLKKEKIRYLTMKAPGGGTRGSVVCPRSTSRRGRRIKKRRRERPASAAAPSQQREQSNHRRNSLTGPVYSYSKEEEGGEDSTLVEEVGVGMTRASAENIGSIVRVSASLCYKQKEGKSKQASKETKNEVRWIRPYSQNQR
eukprot:GHVT01031905.1.p1 GENE.GHVT01031905.1~~GHVT01031905.1.p1  ORF type:complete len:181 (-),score=23.32 GHVT01031905.1:3930-4472(-)